MERPHRPATQRPQACDWHRSWGRILGACTKMQRAAQRDSCHIEPAGIHTPAVHSAETRQTRGARSPAVAAPHRPSAPQTPGSAPRRACTAAFARGGGAGSCAHSRSPSPHMLIRSRFTLAFLGKGCNEIPGVTRTRSASPERQLSGSAAGEAMDAECLRRVVFSYSQLIIEHAQPRRI